MLTGEIGDLQLQNLGGITEPNIPVCICSCQVNVLCNSVQLCSNADDTLPKY
jgi:hypothetical protein